MTSAPPPDSSDPSASDPPASGGERRAKRASRTPVRRAKPSRAARDPSIHPSPIRHDRDTWVRPKTALLLSALSGAFYFLAFPGMGAWPLAFVTYVPLLVAVRGQTVKRAALLGLIAGATMNVGGFYWLLEMLETFSGFPAALCMVFVLLVSMAQGARVAVCTWLDARARQRGWPPALAFSLGFIASELAYPLLFPWYFAGTLHNALVLAQVADLGGPLLVGMMLVGVNLAVTELVGHFAFRAPASKRLVIAGASGLAFALVYGLVRTAQVDDAAERAEAAKVGVVQGNMGLFQKREDPGEGLRRHQRLSEQLRDDGADFVVWSESSVTFAVPEAMAGRFMHDRVAARLGIPAIFGAVVFRVDPDRERWFNTALSTDAQGEVTGRYDKQYLLAFGEYLPFGETFPELYSYSPNSGKFSPGSSVEPLVVPIQGKPRRLTTLICYEDIIPGFTNAAVDAAGPDLLVNLTNDAWFGDTIEPWQHLALAQFRAIEHRRFLVRATNSGVSAVVDPVGRVTAHTGTFKVEHLLAPIRWMNASTVYERVGDAPWILLTALALFAAFWRVPKRWRRGEGPAPSAHS